MHHLDDQARVELGDSVDLVGANDGEEGHPDLLDLTLLDERHAREFGEVPGELVLDLLEPELVDVEDDLHVAGEEGRDEGHRPLLEGLGHDGVVLRKGEVLSVREEK